MYNYITSGHMDLQSIYVLYAQYVYIYVQYIYIYHHHHHVPEGLGVFPVP